MNHVIRRMLFLALAALALAGCGASEREAVVVGESSISEDGLVDMVLALNGGSPDGTVPPAVSADVARQIADVVIRDLASVEYLRSTGVTLSDDEREEIKNLIEDAIADPTSGLGPIDRQSDGYEAITYNVWIASRPGDLGTPEADSAIDQLVREANVSSRVGRLDGDTNLLVSRG